MDDSNLQETLNKRAAGPAASLAVAAKAVALEDHRRMLHDAARRVRESHKAMAKAAGMSDLLENDGDADEMGDIVISGDTNIIHPESRAAPAPAPVTSSGLSTGAKVAVGAAALLGAAGLGAAGPLAYLALKDRPTEVAPVVATGTDTDTQYRLRILGSDE